MNVYVIIYPTTDIDNYMGSGNSFPGSLRIPLDNSLMVSLETIEGVYIVFLALTFLSRPIFLNKLLKLIT